MRSFDNCHSHVARCLNDMKYGGNRNWNMIWLCFWMFACGKYVSVGRAIASWLPFCIILTIILVVTHYA